MRDQGQLILGALIVVIGVVFLIGNVLDVDVWALCWPTALILLGLGFLFRPQFISGDTAVRQKFIGDIRRDGVWQVADEEFWLGVGDLRLDMTQAQIPEGETHIRVWAIVAPVRLRLPPDVGVSVSSTAFVTDARVLGRKRETILAPFRSTSDGYEDAARRIRLEAASLVGDIKVERITQ